MKNNRLGILNKILSNVPLKILSIVIAAFIWYFVQGEEILEINRRLDVTFEVPPGLAIREGNTVYRDVTLRGPRIALSDFSNKPIQATIRLPVGKKGAQRYRLDKEMIPRWDNQIKVTVHDPFVNLFVDDRASKSVPVKVSTIGSPAKGMSIQELKADPSEVTITGLKSDIQKIQDISTEILDIDRVAESKSYPVPLSVSGLPPFELSADQVVVRLTLAEGTSSRLVAGVVVDVFGTDYVASVHPKSVNVLVQGSSEEIARISSKDVLAFVDARDLSPGRYEKSVQIKSIYTVSSAAQPDKVRLEISNQKKLR